MMMSQLYSLRTMQLRLCPCLRGLRLTTLSQQQILGQSCWSLTELLLVEGLSSLQNLDLRDCMSLKQFVSFKIRIIHLVYSEARFLHPQLRTIPLSRACIEPTQNIYSKDTHSRAGQGKTRLFDNVRVRQR